MRALSHDGEYTGVGERGIEKELDKAAQFERFGFVRSDGVSGDGVVAYLRTGESVIERGFVRRE